MIESENINVMREIRKVTVIAGTPVDTKMGVDFIKRKNTLAEEDAVLFDPRYCPVSEDCDAQIKFQYMDDDGKRAAMDALYDACYPAGFCPGGVTLEGVWWNGTLAPAAFDDAAQTALRISIPDLAAEESGTLLLRCRLDIPACAHRFGHSEGIWQFGNALPVLSVYENGAWRSDPYSPIGDPFFSECANYTATLLVPKGYQCAASGTCTMADQADGQVRYTLSINAARELAFVLSDQWQSAKARINGITVQAFGPNADAVRRAAQDGAKALKTYAALYGAYPYASLTVCAVDFPFGGMEYPGLMMISLPYFENDRADSLELVIAHEAAHQWFYALVGSDPVREPWQDEALSEYAMLRYVRQNYGASAYENLRTTRVDAPMRERILQPLTPATPITDFSSLDAYTAVVYGRGAAFLLAAEELTGKVDGFLRAYCDAFAFQIASREDFISLLNRYTQEDIRPLMTDYLDTLMQ